MNCKRIFSLTGLLAGGAFALSAAPVQAAVITFTPFSFSNTISGSIGGNQMLEQVVVGSRRYGKSDMVLVSSVSIVHNDLWTKGNEGAASADIGVGASIGLSVEAPTGVQLAQALGNLNMNSIVDTEDTGSFVLDVSFARAAQDFFFWERGMNSRLTIQALDAFGSVIAEFNANSHPDARQFQNAGFSILTGEIYDAGRGTPQVVGSLGLRLSQATNRLRLISNRNFAGPDFKVMAAVPEPMTMTGTALAAGAVLLARRKQRKQASDATQG